MPDEPDKNFLRDRVESATHDIPEGPLGKAGGGNLIGAAGFVAVESTRPVAEFIPGLKQPGYKINAHGMEHMGDYERHKLTVVAISENVARWAAQYTAAPSNIDFATSETEIVDVEEVTERRTYSTYRIVVDVADRWSK